MFNLLRNIVLLGCLSLISMPAFADKVLAEVNGQKITQQDIDAFKQFLSKNTKNKMPSDEQLLNELIKREVIYQEALKNKIDKDPELAYIIEQQKRSVVIQSHVSKTGVANVPEKDIKELYQQIVDSQARREYKIKHIQVATEAEANKIIEALNDDADFEALAKTHSRDPSGKNGGDIGWLSSNQLQSMPNVLAMLKTMQKGIYSTKAVKTEHGWHILWLDDTREAAAAPYEQLKPQLTQVIQGRRLNAYIESLKKEANIKIH